MCDKCYETGLLVEQHFHGCFGIDFCNCSADDILLLAEKMLAHGIGGFFPTLATDTPDNIKKQIAIIKEAKARQTEDMAEILGIHIEGIFINPAKKGIHDTSMFMEPSIANYKLIEDDFIKIVTLAPELDKNGELQKYLTSKGIKVQAGHCVDGKLELCDCATHLFNAMGGVHHREQTTALTALIKDDLYVEVIADGVHLSNDILELIFKAKPKDKVILISDSLPIAESELAEMEFMNEKIYYDGTKATSKDGTIAGSTTILSKIVKKLALQHPDKFYEYAKMASDNPCQYHKITLKGKAFWNDKFDVIGIEK